MQFFLNQIWVPLVELALIWAIARTVRIGA